MKNIKAKLKNKIAKINMIFIIHGDDIVASRKKLTSLKKDFKDAEVFQFEGEKTSVTDIIQVFESQSLFAKKKLIVLEKFIETKDKALVAQVFNELKKNASHEVIFWEPKEVKRELLELLPKQATVLFFKQERLLFRFLDSIRLGNTREMLSLLYQVRSSEADELVFYMLVRQFRLLLAITLGSNISEVKRLAPWQRSKLERQARAFGEETLLILYRRLFQIEREVKTGANALPLSASLDLFLASI